MCPPGKIQVTLKKDVKRGLSVSKYALCMLIQKNHSRCLAVATYKEVRDVVDCIPGTQV